MAQNDLLKRYLDAGTHFTQITQQRAEAIVRDLVKAGEVQAESAGAVVSDLLDRSRKNSERLIQQIRKEIKAQVTSLGLATQRDIKKLESRLSGGGKKAAAPAKEAVASAKKTVATAKKSAPAKKAVAATKKTVATAKKAPAKRVAAKKS